jgi:hypothetical protein
VPLYFVALLRLAAALGREPLVVAKTPPPSAGLTPALSRARQKRKAEEEAQKRELNEIFVATIKQPKVPDGAHAVCRHCSASLTHPPPGVDPKSVVCEFFRKGSCTKGFKCKFSHDLGVERKVAKPDMYADRRDGESETMEDWDQEKLEAAIAAKHGSHNVNRPTDIICKHFLDAIEKKQFGWFWICPGGGDECKYRHALPPGYVMKSQIKALAAEAAANKKTLEEEIEEQRSSMAATTPVTEEVFQAWKRRKLAAKASAQEAVREERVKAGRLSGRELTELGGFTFEDDLDAGDTSAYTREARSGFCPLPPSAEHARCAAALRCAACAG